MYKRRSQTVACAVLNIKFGNKKILLGSKVTIRLSALSYFVRVLSSHSFWSTAFHGIPQRLRKMHRFHFWRTREMDRTKGEKREKKKQAGKKEWKRNLGKKRRWWWWWWRRRLNGEGDEGKEEGKGDAVREDNRMGMETPWDRTHASRPAQRVAMCVLLFSLRPFFFSRGPSQFWPISFLFFSHRSLSLTSQFSVQCQSVNFSFCLRPRLPPVSAPNFGVSSK